MIFSSFLPSRTVSDPWCWSKGSQSRERESSLKIVQKEEFSRQLFLKMPTYRDLKTRRKVFEE